MTSLIRWNRSPVRDLLSFQDDVDRLFEGLSANGGTGRGAPLAAFAPALDLEETRDEFVLRADLPGVSQKDVKVSLLDDTLTIQGERKTENEKREGNLHRVERHFGSFERSVRFAVPVRGDQVKASVRDGVLEIHVPKAEEAKVREIEVQVSS